MGETDVETMANVTIAKYDFDDEAFDEISVSAKDFITKLLLKDKGYVLMVLHGLLKHTNIFMNYKKIYRKDSI